MTGRAKVLTGPNGRCRISPASIHLGLFLISNTTVGILEEFVSERGSDAPRSPVCQGERGTEDPHFHLSPEALPSSSGDLKSPLAGSGRSVHRNADLRKASRW